MKRCEEMAAAVKSVAWGYIFLHLNFNLGTLDLLPDWWGICLIVKALNTIAREEASAKLLRPLGILLGVWAGLQWIVKLLGGAWDWGIIDAVVAVISLYFHFQLLTNLAAVSEKFWCPETNRILTLRTVDTVMITLLALPLPWEEHELLVFGIILVEVAVAIWLCQVLFSLCRSLVSRDPDTADLPSEFC